MPKTVLAIYSDLTTAHEAIVQLLRSGFDREAISLVSNDDDGQYAELLGNEHQGRRTGRPAAEGAAIGGVSGLLVALGAMALPGLGPIVVAGPVATVLANAGVGAGIGAAAGGLVGALTAHGVPDGHAKRCAEAVERGHALVAVHADDARAEAAAAILEAKHPVDPSLVDRGWRSTPEKAVPHTPEDVQRQRSSQRASQAEDPHAARVWARVSAYDVTGRATNL